MSATVFSLDAGDFKPGEDPYERLVLEGRPATLHKDVKKQADAAAFAALVPCHGNREIMVDR